MEGDAIADVTGTNIEEKKTSKEIYHTLTNLYEVRSLQNKIFLKRRPCTLRMLEST